MCLRFVFLLITRIATWLRLSRRDEAWNTAEILIPRHQLAGQGAGGRASGTPAARLRGRAMTSSSSTTTR
jgi:hypothetical protein